jgi:SAM-dependent methyltransferase
LAEIARVLRPGGVLAALWNGDDTGVEWMRGYREAGGWEHPAPPRAEQPPTLPVHAEFEPSEHATFRNPVRTTLDGLIATLATHSWALTAEPADRDVRLGRVRAYLTDRPETSRGGFELPLVTDVLRALRR